MKKLALYFMLISATGCGKTFFSGKTDSQKNSGPAEVKAADANSSAQTQDVAVDPKSVSSTVSDLSVSPNSPDTESKGDDTFVASNPGDSADGGSSSIHGSGSSNSGDTTPPAGSDADSNAPAKCDGVFDDGATRTRYNTDVAIHGTQECQSQTQTCKNGSWVGGSFQYEKCVAYGRPMQFNQVVWETYSDSTNSQRVSARTPTTFYSSIGVPGNNSASRVTGDGFDPFKYGEFINANSPTESDPTGEYVLVDPNGSWAYAMRRVLVWEVFYQDSFLLFDDGKLNFFVRLNCPNGPFDHTVMSYQSLVDKVVAAGISKIHRTQMEHRNVVLGWIQESHVASAYPCQ